MLPISIFAQSDSLVIRAPADSIQMFTSDSLQTISIDTIGVGSDSTAFIMKKSPWTAVGYSALLPGAGQYYNESKWKIAVIWGVLGWFIYNYIDNNNKYNDYKTLYENTSLDSYRKLRIFYSDQRDLFAIYIGLTYLANLVDAYVDAHLFDFDVSEDPFSGNPQLNLKIPF